MFKIPEWEDDIPKNSVNFSKSKPNRKNHNAKLEKRPTNPKISASPNRLKLNDVKKKDTSVQNNKFIRNDNDKKARKRKLNSKVEIQNIDTDKIDEVLLNAKKKKFNEKLIKDDNENDLFKEERDLPKQNKIKSTLTVKKNRIKIKQTNVNEKVKNHKNKPIDKTIFKVFNNMEEKNETDNNTELNEENAEKNVMSNNSKNNVKKTVVTKKSKENNKTGNNMNKKHENIPLVNGKTKPETNKNNIELQQPLSRTKNKLKTLLQSNRNSINVNGNKLRERMLERLKAAQFRYLNEKLYTSSGGEAKQLFQSDPTAFHTYHQGYQQQIKKWPVNPLDLIVKRISKMPKTHVIADMGCGEAALSKRVPHTVRSFDLVASNNNVEVCDIAHTPLAPASVDVAVYCLALMGTELTQYLVEANRVLKINGHLLIAEVESRFDNVDNFTKDITKLGFKLKNLDKSHQVFFFMEFIKVREAPVKKSKLPVMTLKPCLYKRR